MSAGRPPRHPLDAFLDEWARGGGEDGVDVRVRVHEAFSLEGASERGRARATLRAILVRDEKGEARFDGLFPRDGGLPPWLLEALPELREWAATNADEREHEEIAPLPPSAVAHPWLPHPVRRRRPSRTANRRHPGSRRAPFG